MDYQTNEQLSEMRLHAMRLEYQRQQELPAMQDLSFDERFSMIVMEQYNARCEAKFNRLIRAAEYSRAAEPPVRWGESHMSGLTGATLL